MAWVADTVTFLTIDLLEVTSTSEKYIPWQIFALISFLFFCGFVAWRFYQKISRINELEQQRPKLSVSHFMENGAGYLRVHNKGGFAKVWGIGEVINGDLSNERWKEAWHIPWRFVEGSEPAQITRDGMAILGLGAAYGKKPELFETIYVELKNGDRGVETIALASSTIEIPCPELTIKITITSEPPALHGSFVKNYRVKVIGKGTITFEPE